MEIHLRQSENKVSLISGSIIRVYKMNTKANQKSFIHIFHLMKRITQKLIAVTFLIAVCSICEKNPASGESNYTKPVLGTDVSFWMTSPIQQILFKEQNISLRFGRLNEQYPVIDVNEATTYQEMDGFGYTLTGGSAIWINRMDKTSRTTLLKELFATDDANIGVSYLRISIGASDLSDEVFTYDDITAGATDPELKNFSINYERTDLISVLKEILEINPKLKILGSPWSAPRWMKDNNDSRGGSLKPEYYDVYARYFVKYIQEMNKEGITIDAITVQNEPLHPGNNPSMYMTATDQAIFVKRNLGPSI